MRAALKTVCAIAFLQDRHAVSAAARATTHGHHHGHGAGWRIGETLHE